MTNRRILIPMKPGKIIDGITGLDLQYFCPETQGEESEDPYGGCGEELPIPDSLVPSTFKFCPFCGQPIDWSIES